MSALSESVTPLFKDIATLMNHHNYHDIPKIVINGHNDLSYNMKKPMAYYEIIHIYFEKKICKLKEALL